METKKTPGKTGKGVSLLDLQKALLKTQQEKVNSMKGGVLVESIPVSRAGFVRDDRHYITPEALCINIVGVLQNCLR